MTLRSAAKAGRVTRFSAVGALATGIAAVQCAAELEDPERFPPFPGAAPGTGGTAGSTGAAGGPAKAVTTPDCVKAIVATNCAKTFCHHPMVTDLALRGGLDLTGDNPAAAVVDVPASYLGIATYDDDRAGACIQGAKIIDSQFPDKSNLMARLHGTQPCGINMPPPPTILDAAQMTCLTTWIMAPYAAANVVTTGSGGASSGGEGKAGKADGG